MPEIPSNESTTGSPLEQVTRLMLELDRLTAIEWRELSTQTTAASEAVQRVAVVETRVELAVLTGALREVEALAEKSIRDGDDVTAKAALQVHEQLQEAFEVVRLTLAELSGEDVEPAAN